MDRISDETLMAFADEALSRAEMSRVAAMVAQDPNLAARLEPFAVTRAALPKIFSDAELGPIPKRLLDTVMSAPIGRPERSSVSGGAFSQLRNLLFPETLSFGRALTVYGTVLGIVGAGWMISRTGSMGERQDLLATQNGKTLARGVLARALESGPMLQRVAAADGQTATAVVTFKNADGYFCRQFEASRTEADVFSGYACRNASGDWQVGFQSSGPSLASGGGGTEAIRPADRQSNPDLDAAIEAIISGDALDASGESTLIANGWKRDQVKRGD